MKLLLCALVCVSATSAFAEISLPRVEAQGIGSRTDSTHLLVSYPTPCNVSISGSQVKISVGTESIVANFSPKDFDDQLSSDGLIHYRTQSDALAEVKTFGGGEWSGSHELIITTRLSPGQLPLYNVSALRGSRDFLTLVCNPNYGPK